MNLLSNKVFDEVCRKKWRVLTKGLNCNISGCRRLLGRVRSN